MRTQETTQASSRQIHQQYERLLQFSSHEDLVRCTRLMGLYLAMYKHEFGELSAETCNRYVQTGDESENDLLIAEIFNSGLQEVTSLLTLITANDRQFQQVN